MKKVQIYIKSDEENAFLSSPNLIKALIIKYIFFISNATILSFLTEEGFGWKGPIIRVKMKCFKTPRLTI